MNKLEVSSCDTSNVLAMAPGLGMSCAVSTLNGRMLCHRPSGVTVLGAAPAQKVFTTLSYAPGAEVLGMHTGTIVIIVSTLTGEVVADFKTTQHRIAIGNHTIACVCAEGIKACALSSTEYPVWVDKFSEPCRIAYTDNDVLVCLLRTKYSRFVFKTYDLAAYDWSSNRSRWPNNNPLPQPTNFGKLTASSDSLFTFLYNTPSSTALGVVRLDRPGTVTSVKLSTPAFSEDMIDITRCTSVVDNSDIIYATLYATTPDLTSSHTLVVQNGAKASFTNTVGESFVGIDANTNAVTVAVKGHKALSVTATMETAPIKNSSVVNGTRFRLVGHQRKCSRCRRIVPSGSIGTMLCDACNNKGSFAYEFGRALKYARTKYKFMPSLVEERAYMIAWRTHPYCWRFGTSYKDKRIVFTKICKTDAPTLSNMILQRMDQVMDRPKQGSANIARRRMAQAMEAAREELAQET